MQESVKMVLLELKELEIKTKGQLSTDQMLKVLELAYRNDDNSQLCNYFPEVFWHEFCGAMRACFGNTPTIPLDIRNED